MFACACHAAQAQGYPTRTIRVLVGFTPGGTTDVVARVIAQKLSEQLKQSVVIDNRPGAGANIAAELAAKAPPDGYTLLAVNPGLAISATLYQKLPYDPLKDLEPIALPSRSPLVLVVNPKLGIKSTRQLIDYAKSKGKDFSFASSGPGSITHLTGERFIRETGIHPLHVPYKGGGPATAATL